MYSTFILLSSLAGSSYSRFQPISSVSSMSRLSSPWFRKFYSKASENFRYILSFSESASSPMIATRRLKSTPSA